jgi:hypothetical protein
MACDGEMILMQVVRDDTMPVPGFEYHTFTCADCDDVERRLVFTKDGRESNAEPMPIAPPTVPAGAAPDERIAVPGLLRRVVAKLRGP